MTQTPLRSRLYVAYRCPRCAEEHYQELGPLGTTGGFLDAAALYTSVMLAEGTATQARIGIISFFKGERQFYAAEFTPHDDVPAFRARVLSEEASVRFATRIGEHTAAQPIFAELNEGGELLLDGSFYEEPEHLADDDFVAFGKAAIERYHAWCEEQRPTGQSVPDAIAEKMRELGVPFFTVENTGDLGELLGSIDQELERRKAQGAIPDEQAPVQGPAMTPEQLKKLMGG